MDGMTTKLTTGVEVEMAMAASFNSLSLPEVGLRAVPFHNLVL